jgi:eukaryotic-like serine/threonine-protein kinase
MRERPVTEVTRERRPVETTRDRRGGAPPRSRLGGDAARGRRVDERDPRAVDPARDRIEFGEPRLSSDEPGCHPTWTAPVDWRGPTYQESADDLDLEPDRLPGPLQFRDRQRYTVIREHGRGGLGRVLRARDRELDRDVAIKELLAPGRTAELRFFREALITARLEHPGIVPVHEAGRWPDGTPFYAMKLVSGRSLEELIDAVGDLSDRLALVANVVAVADAIGYAHENGIVHRDLKPSNVIVGDHGETVVVDWGLAKSLRSASAAEEVVPDGPYRMPAPEGVTFPGGPLGTPAFMPPEQFVGQSDERSDIFALGGILYHVLSGRPPRGTTMEEIDPFNVPPLRVAAPKDLIAIAMRALAQDPADRYPTARGFAEDLRRFMRRQPVVARRYSIFARAALGFLRHRTVATALLAAVVLVAVASVIGGVRSSRQRQRAERALDELALKHAELLLESDPTASARVLDDYRGADSFTRDFLRAQARGLGVARLVASPHIDTVHFLGAIDGDVLSLSEDQQVVRTSAAGSRVLAGDVGRYGAPATEYAPAARVLAYGHHMGGVTVRHLDSGSSELRRDHVPVQAVALSADGRRLAILAQTGALYVDRLGGPETPALAQVPDARLVRFAGPDTLVVTAPDSVRAIDASSSAVRGSYPVGAGEALATADDRVAIGAMDGSVHVVDLAGMTPIAVARVCDGIVNAVAFIERRGLIGFACQDGTAGALDPGTGQPAVSFSIERPAFVLAATRDGRFLAAAGESGVIHVHDLETGLMSRYLGHGAPIEALSAPGDDATPLISADANGVIRVWDLPRPADRVVMRGSKAIYHAVFSPDGRFLAADGADGVIRLLDRERGGVAELKGHTNMVYGIAFARERDELATWGYDGTVRLWSPSRGAAGRVLSGHRGLVKDGDYLDGDTLVTAGADGRLLAWRPDGTAREIFRTREPFLSLEPLRALRSVVVSDAAGRIHLVSERGQARELPTDGLPITMLRAAGDGRAFATGTADGTVRVYEAGAPRVVLKAAGPIRHIAFSPDRSLLLVASEDGRVHMRALGKSRAPWQMVPVRGRYVAFSPDGSLAAITTGDGTVWYYSIETGAWRFTQPHAADTFTGQFAPDGRSFASSDGAGVVVVHEIAHVESARANRGAEGAE